MLRSGGSRALAALGVAAGGYYAAAQVSHADQQRVVSVDGEVPTRAQQLTKLRACTRDNPCDLLIVGGGATGAGCAVDAATRGLRTVLIEREDFASGTSSKSTKLVHGGVRYLEKAVFNLDYEQFKLVREALQERRSLLDNASHITTALPIVMPCYKWWEVPFYWAGLKAYDLIAGFKNLAFSKYLTPSESQRRLPTLADHREDGASLKGSILYYDGQFDDARLNVALAASAAAAGAAVMNYMAAEGLIKDAAGRVIGVRCRDKETGRLTEVYARVVLNATGPFADQLRQLSSPQAPKCLTTSSGTHVTLPGYYGSPNAGMIIPKTKDGRVVFMLPFQDHVIAGTTDSSCGITAWPRATQEEVTFILDALSGFLGIQVRQEDVLSAWNGIRPLAADPSKQDTQNIVRDHVIFADDDGLLTITGGKWTTYRRMAEEAVDAVVAAGGLEGTAGACCTQELRLRGAGQWHRNLNVQVAQKAGAFLGSTPLPTGAAQHLATAYGDRVWDVLQLAGTSRERHLASPLVAGHPYLAAEVVYCCRAEFCRSVTDFLARRTRLAFLDTAACAEAIPKVAELMAAELGWGGRRKRREVANANAYLQTFKV